MKTAATLTLKLFVPLFIITAFLNPVTAQQSGVTFKIINQKREPVPFATVTVINRNDSLQNIKRSADSSGSVTISLAKNELYSVSITSVNYQPLEKGILLSPGQSSFTFALEPLPKTLKDVVVTSKKPLMRQEDDKTIVEPENLVAASTNGYEVIEKTPGLFVDQDGNIYISSLSPAAVQINGREMRMSAADVATMLKSLPPGAIARIEIVRTPSARYDASSSGGIVNVVLKKGVKIGMTGSINTGMQQGTFGNQFLGFNLNNNDGKKSSYINLNYMRRNSYERIVTDRIFAPDSMLGQQAYTRYPADAYFAGYGLSLSKNKWDIDFSGNISLNNARNKTENNSSIEKISNGQVITRNLNNVSNRNNSFVIGNGIEAKLKLDSAGSEWATNFFYYYAHNTSDQDFSTIFFTPAVPATGGDGKADNKRDFFSAKTDLKLKMKNRFVLESGARSTIHLFKNVTDYFRESGGNRVKDLNRTNTFDYDENINSLYLQGSKTFAKDIVVKFGTRLENTNMRGRQIIPDDTTFAIHRTDLFPYVYLSKNLMKIAGYDLRAYLVYRRTITRPVYEQLNPFSRYIDQYLSEAGNPSLRPQFNQNYEANISVDERPILAVGVNNTTDIFTNVIYQADTSQSQAYRTYDNLGKNREWYFRGLGALPPGGKYFFVAGAQYNHNFYEGLYENKPLSFKRGSWTLFTYHTLKLGKLSMFTLNGFVRFKGQQQFYELTTFGALNASINRQFMKQKLIVTLSVNDMFFSNKNNFTIQQGSVSASGSRVADTRRFGFNIRYNFGMRKKENNNLFNIESPEGAN